MPSKHPPMRLSREEESFLRHWMYDETHYRQRAGVAKRLQVEQGALVSRGLSAVFFGLSLIFVWRSFYGMRIGSGRV